MLSKCFAPSIAIKRDKIKNKPVTNLYAYFYLGYK